MNDQVALDLLVEWCSVQGSGSRSQFDRACSNVVEGDEKPSQILERLELLGVVEVDWAESGRWAANPPVLAHVRGSGGNAALIGARTKATWLAINTAVEEGIAASVSRPRPVAGFPTTWYVGVKSENDLPTIATRIGVSYTNSLVDDYLKHFLDLDQMIEVSSTEFPLSGFRSERLDPTTLWYELAEVERGRWPPGAFRQLSGGRRHYLFVDDDGKVHVLDRWTATHAELRRQHLNGNHVPEVLRVDFDTQRLAVRAAARLPSQWARVAMACSGMPPRQYRETGVLWDLYEGVSPLVFKRLREILRYEDLVNRSSDLSQVDMEVTR